jgi:hypothetical protein
VKRAAGLTAFLTLLVWGLFGFDHGLFHDDASLLFVAQRGASHAFGALFEPSGAPTRLLQTLPYAVAWATAAPTLVLQLWYGAAWVATALLVYALARSLAPGAPLVAPVACALATTATSDFLTNATEALSYLDATAFLLAGLVAAIRWTRGGHGAWLALAVLLANASVFTLEGLAPTAALAPLFLLAAEGRPERRGRAAAAWLLALAPFGAVFTAYLLDPSSYAAVALRPLGLVARLRGVAGQTATDFLPWRWPLSRPVWFDVPPRVLPAWLSVAAAAAGVAAFLAAVRREARPGAADGPDGPRIPLAAAACLLVLLSQHAAYAGAQLADRRYRTQLVSRVFASLLVALLTGLLARRLRRPATALALPAVFVAFGIAGGLERHDFFLSSWRRERTELASTLAEAPSLDPTATLVLSLVPDPGGYQATRVPYLAQSWMALLRDDPDLAGRTVVWLPVWGATCRPETAGLACAESANGGAPLTIPWDRLVLLSFDAASGRYRLVPSIPASGGAYRPEALVRDAPVPERARELLAGPRFLGRLLPGALARDAMLAP